MAMLFEELDSVTRRWMLSALIEEEASTSPYRSKVLSSEGLFAFPEMVRGAIEQGTEVDLATSLGVQKYWNLTEGSSKRVNYRQAANRLAVVEFNTWYVRGLCR